MLCCCCLFVFIILFFTCLLFVLSFVFLIVLFPGIIHWFTQRLGTCILDSQNSSNFSSKLCFFLVAQFCNFIFSYSSVISLIYAVSNCFCPKVVWWYFWAPKMGFSKVFSNGLALPQGNRSFITDFHRRKIRLTPQA